MGRVPRHRRGSRALRDRRSGFRPRHPRAGDVRRRRGRERGASSRATAPRIWTRTHRSSSRPTTRRSTSISLRSSIRSSPAVSRASLRRSLWRAMVFVAARPAGRLVAGALALGWLALAAGHVWGPALKPDLVALGLTVVAVVLLDRRRDLRADRRVRARVRRAREADRAACRRPRSLCGSGGRIARRCIRCGFGRGRRGRRRGRDRATSDSVPDVWRHVVTWNALAWSSDQAVSVAVLGVLLVIGLPLGTAALGSRGLVERARIPRRRARDRRARRTRGRDDQLPARSRRRDRALVRGAVAASAPRRRRLSRSPRSRSSCSRRARRPASRRARGACRRPARGAIPRASRSSRRSSRRGEPLLVEDSGLLVASGARRSWTISSCGRGSSSGGSSTPTPIAQRRSASGRYPTPSSARPTSSTSTPPRLRAAAMDSGARGAIARPVPAGERTIGRLVDLRAPLTLTLSIHGRPPDQSDRHCHRGRHLDPAAGAGHRPLVDVRR